MADVWLSVFVKEAAYFRLSNTCVVALQQACQVVWSLVKWFIAVIATTELLTLTQSGSLHNVCTTHQYYRRTTIMCQ